MMTKIKVNCILQHGNWKKYIKAPKKETNFIALQLFNKLKLDNLKRAELSVLFTCNDEISRLNHEFRGKKKPTNVLSFPDREIDFRELNNIKFPLTNNYLGDIAIAFETVEQEAIEQKKRFIDHFTHLIIHAILHLLGFDHINESDAEIMEGVEIELLKEMGIDSPYD